MTVDQRAIRVMHVASGDLWAGAEVQIAELARAIVRQPGVAVAAVILNEGTLYESLKTAGANVRLMPESQHSAWRLYQQMVSFMREWRPDIVHTHRQKENVLGALAARSAHVRVCLRTIHGAPEMAYSWWPLNKHAPRIVDALVARRWQQRAVAVSDELASRMAMQLRNAAISVIPNGIDSTFVRMRASEPIALEPGVQHVAFLGRLVPVKRVDLFIQAAAALATTDTGRYRFHIIGDGPLRQALEKQTLDLKLDECCVFHGFQSNAPQWLAAMHCLVLCSDHEGVPMTALEARALGIPVVAHAVGGIPDLLNGAADCRLVQIQDPELIAAAIREACAARHQPATSRLPDKYSIAATATRYRSLYEELLASSRAA